MTAAGLTPAATGRKLLDETGTPWGNMAGLYSTTLRYVTERRKLGEFSRSTARDVWYTLAQFSASAGEQLPVGRVTKRHVEKWMLGRDVAPGTLRTEFSRVRSFCTWCVDHDLMRRDPCRGIRGPRRPRVKPRALDRDQISKVLLEADERGRVCLLLMCQEGLRRSEVVGLTTDSVEVEKRLLFVTGKGGHERFLPLSDETAAAIEEYLAVHPAGPGMPLVRSYRYPTRPLHPGTLSQLVAGWMKSAGVKSRPRDGKSAHSLRHSCANDMLDAGAELRDVQEMLGHQLLSTTSVYASRQAALGKLREAAAGRAYLP